VISGKIAAKNSPFHTPPTYCPWYAHPAKITCGKPVDKSPQKRTIHVDNLLKTTPLPWTTCYTCVDNSAGYPQVINRLLTQKEGEATIYDFPLRAAGLPRLRPVNLPPLSPVNILTPKVRTHKNVMRLLMPKAPHPFLNVAP